MESKSVGVFSWCDWADFVGGKPYGFVQKQSGCSGSRKEMCPLIPSEKPLRANTLKAPAMCSSIHRRFLSAEVKEGMLGRVAPCEMAWMADLPVMFDSVGCGGSSFFAVMVVVVEDMVLLWEVFNVQEATKRVRVSVTV